MPMDESKVPGLLSLPYELWVGSSISSPVPSPPCRTGSSGAQGSCRLVSHHAPTGEPEVSVPKPSTRQAAPTWNRPSDGIRRFGSKVPNAISLL